MEKEQEDVNSNLTAQNLTRTKRLLVERFLH